MKIIQISANEKTIVGLGDDGVIYIRREVKESDGKTKYVWLEDISSTDTITLEEYKKIKVVR